MARATGALARAKTKRNKAIDQATKAGLTDQSWLDDQIARIDETMPLPEAEENLPLWRRPRPLLPDGRVRYYRLHPYLKPSRSVAVAVRCPDCGEMESWHGDERAGHGMCRTAGRCAVCDAAGDFVDAAPDAPVYFGDGRTEVSPAIPWRRSTEHVWRGWGYWHEELRRRAHLASLWRQREG